MSSLNQRYRRDTGYQEHETRRDERRRYSRSRSRSRQRRYRRDDSRGRSPLEYRRRHYGRRSRTRSRSRSLSRHDRYTSSRRYRDSRSRSRSRSRSATRTYRSSKRTTRSRSRSTDEKLMRKLQNNKKAIEEAIKLKTNEAATPSGSVDEQEDTDTNSKADMNTDLDNLPLPKREPIGAYYNLDIEEPIDKERIHREMEEKLRQTLAREGKVYPPKKPEASHPVFANDGSFLELFKKMQQAQQNPAPSTSAVAGMHMAPSAAAAAPAIASTSNAAVYINATASGKSAPPPPFVGRRRGGKILKTGVVAKQKAQSEQSDDPKDFWSLYLAEVNKYKSHACETDTGNRPLVK